MDNVVVSSPDYRRVAEALKQASDPTRLRVLARLAEGERNVSGLLDDLGMVSQPALSHHLALLYAGRLVERRRAGKNHFYDLTDRGRVLVAAAQSMAE